MTTTITTGTTTMTTTDQIWQLAQRLCQHSRKVAQLWAADCAEAGLRFVRDGLRVEHSLAMLGEVRRCAVTGEHPVIDGAAATTASVTAAAAAALSAAGAYGAAYADTYTAEAAYEAASVAANAAAYAHVYDAADDAADADADTYADAFGVANAYDAADADAERAWQVALALGYLGDAEMPTWPEGMGWR